MAATYTSVTYFNDEDLEEVAAGFRRLERSYLERKPHLSPRAQAAIERRLDVLRHAWAMLLEDVPRRYE